MPLQITILCYNMFFSCPFIGTLSQILHSACFIDFSRLFCVILFLISHLDHNLIQPLGTYFRPFVTIVLSVVYILLSYLLLVQFVVIS